jgi:phosphosulfolactate synthase (CoM biosynthesis protein A)
MPETVSFNCSSIEDTTPYIDDEGVAKVEVTLADVDVQQIVQEVGLDNLLFEMKEEEVMQYFADKKQLEEGE